MTGYFVVISLLLLMPAFTYFPYGVLAAIIEVAVVGLVDVGIICLAQNDFVSRKLFKNEETSNRCGYLLMEYDKYSATSYQQFIE